jgi:hypothetical protein
VCDDLLVARSPARCPRVHALLLCAGCQHAHAIRLLQPTLETEVPASAVSAAPLWWTIWTSIAHTAQLSLA